MRRTGACLCVLAGLLPGLGCEGTGAQGENKEKVEFEVDGFHIVGTYYAPQGPRKSPRGMVLTHMLGKRRSDWDAFAVTAAERGWHVLAIDLRGHGDSTNRNGEKVRYTSFLPGKDWLACKRDILAGAAFLADRKGVKKNRVVFIGASIGANLSLHAAADDEDVPAAVLLSPGADFHEVETPETIARYGKRPVMIVTTEGDRCDTAGDCRKLAQLARGPVEIKVYAGNGHGTEILSEEPELTGKVLDWLDSALK